MHEGGVWRRAVRLGQPRTMRSAALMYLSRSVCRSLGGGEAVIGASRLWITATTKVCSRRACAALSLILPSFSSAPSSVKSGSAISSAAIGCCSSPGIALLFPRARSRSPREVSLTRSLS